MKTMKWRATAWRSWRQDGDGDDYRSTATEICKGDDEAGNWACCCVDDEGKATTMYVVGGGRVGDESESRKRWRVVLPRLLVEGGRS